MVASSVGTGKGSRGKDVHPTESLLLRKLSVDAKDALPHKTSALASGHGGVINRDAIYGLLTECLQDVSSTVLVIQYLLGLLLGFLFLFASVLGFKIE
jgi:hypothetical protein